MPLLRFYTEGLDHSALAHIPLVPLIHGIFRGIATEESSLNPWNYRFNDYWQVSSRYLTFSHDLASCDLVVLPYDWYWARGPHWRQRYADPVVAPVVATLNQQLYDKAVAAGKPVVLFFTGDRSHEAVPFPKAIILREGLYQSRRQAQEFVCPAFAEDLLQQVTQINPSLTPGEVVIRPKTDRPTVGFCGLAKPITLNKRVKDLYYHGSMLVSQGNWDFSPYLGEKLRIKAIKRLKSNPDLQTNFIVRSESVFLGTSPDQQKIFRQDYIQNLIESDYILCCRGSGNYSFRLYETLSMGRIPLFLNTDSAFPYDFLQDWQQYCVWVEPKDLKSLPEKVLAFHNALSAQDFIDLQQRCRQFWLEWLSAQGFFSHFHHHLSHLGLIPTPTPES